MMVGGSLLGFGLLLVCLIGGAVFVLGGGALILFQTLLANRHGTTTAITSAPSRGLCLQCGQELQPNWAHCPNCGSPVSQR